MNDGGCGGGTVGTPITLAQSTMTNLIDGGTANVAYEIELPPYGYTILMN
ncbi:MAG: hypothetical protein K2L34_12955 [Muribaculaceae bacterium]|nr:hypothetical protein [Muribaculaceae bacterium]